MRPLFPVLRPKASSSSYQPEACHPQHPQGTCHKEKARPGPLREPYSRDASPKNKNKTGQHVLPLALQATLHPWGLGSGLTGPGLLCFTAQHGSLLVLIVFPKEAQLGAKHKVCFPRSCN